MSKSLVIAEKPSVATDLARVLGKFKKEKDFFENDQYVISSAIGHLVEMVPPGGAEVKRGKWNIENLPVLPDHFDLIPKEKTKSRLQVLKRLVKRPDVTEIINACDAGREGELIFRNTMRWIGGKKPTRRLWLQSMTADSIRAGFEHLRSEQEMQPLADAATSRAESDWLVGINATRALTSFNSRSGGFQKTAAGRVQTPTLAILAGREEKIRSFKPRPYFEVHADLGVKTGSYRGRWFDEKFKNDGDEDARAERLWSHEKAVAIEAKCAGKTGEVIDEKKLTTQAPPLLYDLTTLQREANGRFGLSARRTLQIAQALYEKHKVLTYPRTDSRYLPEDNLGQVRKVMSSFNDQALATHAEKALRNEWIKPTKRVFNNAKVSDHHAIIPTGTSTAHLDDFERKIFDMVARRTIAVFYPAAQFEVTTRITRIEGEPFKTDGKIIVDPGWKAVYGKEAAGEDEQSIAPISPNERANVLAIEVKENETKPPTRFNEATLLSAMEGAGKLVEDEELREAMSERGLGTPATRSQIIEGLIFDGYIHRNGRELQPTPKASSLLFALRHFGINELSSPELTGNWEFKLKQMEHGNLPRSEFMDHIVDLTREMVSRIKRGKIPDTAFRTLNTPCPKCGGKVQENYRKFKCQKCDFSIWKVVSSREFAPEEIETLIVKRSVGPLTGFRSRAGKPFAAMVRLSPEFRAEFDFGPQAGADGTTEAVDFSGQTPLGLCPKCGGRVFEQPVAYTCENSVGPARRCDFRSGRVILQRPIEPEQIQKLLATGKTDLLHRFISRKGRPFSAFLVRGADGKVGFEFAPRAAKAPRRSPEKAAAIEGIPQAEKEGGPKARPKRVAGRARPARNKRAA